MVCIVIVSVKVIGPFKQSLFWSRCFIQFQSYSLEAYNLHLENPSIWDHVHSQFETLQITFDDQSMIIAM